MNVNEERAALRREVLAERASLPAPYRAHKSAALCEQLLQSLDLTVGIRGIEPGKFTVAVYSAFPEEVQLDDFIRGAFKRGVNVAFPVMVSNAHGCSASSVAQTMEMRLVSEERYLENTVPFLLRPLASYRHESEELTAFPFVAGNDLDMIVVPVVSFDAQGNRLGYGGGNYDRYLTQRSEACRVVGVAFSEQQRATIPVEPHDVPLPIMAL